MNFQRTGSHATFFPGKTALDILLALREEGEGYGKIEKLHREMVEKHNTLTKLHLCKCNDDVEKAVELVLKEGVDINIPAKSNRTPLMWASVSPSSEFIKTLIDLGADVNVQRPDDKVSPLNLAACWNNYMGVSVLLEHGANVDIQHKKGGTPLHKSVSQGFFSVSQLLIEHGANTDIQDSKGDTALHKSVSQGFFSVSRLLIEHGANIDIQDSKGDTALHKSVSQGFFSVSRLLIEHGANTDIQDSKGDTALHNSASQGFLDLSQLLTDSGCNINSRNSREQTPLYLAAENKHEHLVRHLLENNGDANMRYKESLSYRIYLVRGKDRGRPAWYYVLVEKALLGLFLKRTNGGSLDVADFGAILKSGWGKDPPESIRMEIKEIADTFPDVQEITVLHVASESASPAIVELLVKYKADVNARDGESYTPLHLAAIHGNIQVVQRLTELKADFNLTTVDGKNAADLAQMNEEREIEEYLRSKGTSYKRDVEKTVETKATEIREYSGKELYAETIENPVGGFEVFTKPHTVVEASVLCIQRDIYPLIGLERDLKRLLVKTKHAHCII